MIGGDLHLVGAPNSSDKLTTFCRIVGACLMPTASRNTLFKASCFHPEFSCGHVSSDAASLHTPAPRRARRPQPRWHGARASQEALRRASGTHGLGPEGSLTIRETVGDIKIAWASLGGARGRLTPKLLQTPCSEQMAVGLAPGSDVPVERRGSRSPAAGVTARHSPPTVEGSRHASQPWN